MWPRIVLCAILGLAAALPTAAQVCTGGAIGFDFGTAVIDAPPNCVGLFRCYDPEVAGAGYQVLPAGCDPTASACTVRATVPLQFPGNHNNNSSIYFDSPVKLFWRDSVGGLVGQCGNPGARIQVDDGGAWIQRSFACGDTGGGEVFELQVSVCGGTGGGTVVTAYGYDFQDHPTSVTDAEGTVTTYVYSDRDLLTTEISEVSGTTEHTYNEHGQLKTRTDARSITMTRTLDELDRVTFEDYPGESVYITYTYDDPLLPFASGRLTRIERDGHGIDYRYDTRYFQDAIQLAGDAPLLDWQYSTDAVGNITGIADLLTPANQCTYGYQDYQYFLTQGDGPWGARSWTYDGIGNRLSETRGGLADTYAYVPNAAGSSTAKLDQINLSGGGTQTFAYDAAGNQTDTDTAGDLTNRTYDAAGRRATQVRVSANASSEFLYDGRGFLRRSTGQSPDTSGNAIFCDGFESGDASAWGGGGGGAGSCRWRGKPAHCMTSRGCCKGSKGRIECRSSASTAGPFLWAIQ